MAVSIPMVRKFSVFRNELVKRGVTKRVTERLRAEGSTVGILKCWILRF